MTARGQDRGAAPAVRHWTRTIAIGDFGYCPTAKQGLIGTNIADYVTSCLRLRNSSRNGAGDLLQVRNKRLCDNPGKDGAL